MHKHQSRLRPSPSHMKGPQLRFTPWAWAKLLYLRDAGPTEVGGFGVTETSDRALITDVCLVKQLCSSITVAFDDDAVADFFDAQVDEGLRPDQFARIWIHTHPGKSPHPSGTDEETFARVFGNCDWALMFILARGGATYARLRFNAGPCGEVNVSAEVDFTQPFPVADHAAWQAEYDVCVHPEEDRWFWPEELLDSPRTRRHQRACEGPELELFEEQFLGGTAWI